MHGTMQAEALVSFNWILSYKVETIDFLTPGGQGPGHLPLYPSPAPVKVYVVVPHTDPPPGCGFLIPATAGDVAH